ncbi:MAG: glutathione peroxidase [Burkholderiales bacterium]|nr:glutathione peroxidase [Burkholderiales bacterium]
MFTFKTAAAFLFGSGALIMANSATAATSPGAECPTILNHRFLSLNGKQQDLCQYRGKVLLVVNTASYCGYTEQYKGLQALYDKYQKRGLTVLGFPANDFGKQEPGSNAEVADFCERTFKVKFPMIEKTSVVEGQANPFYEALFKSTGERPKWNFHKFLVARDGVTVKSFSSRVTPDSDSFIAEVEALLVAK